MAHLSQRYGRRLDEKPIQAETAFNYDDDDDGGDAVPEWATSFSGAVKSAARSVLFWKVAAWFAVGRIIYYFGEDWGGHYLFTFVSMFYFIFTNLGTREAGKLSAYSMFNPGGQKLAGELTADQIDRQLRNGSMAQAPNPAGERPRERFEDAGPGRALGTRRQVAQDQRRQQNRDQYEGGDEDEDEDEDKVLAAALRRSLREQ